MSRNHVPVLRYHLRRTIYVFKLSIVCPWIAIVLRKPRLQTILLLMLKKSLVNENRQQCVEKLQKQADRMVIKSAKRFKPAQVGDNVLVPIPDVDKGRGEFANVRGIVTSDNGNGCYTIGTKHGTLQQPYCWNQFMPTEALLINSNEVGEELISLREVARRESICGGQGFKRCGCSTGCKTNICSCRKEKKLCNSKCHQNTSCCNKWIWLGFFQVVKGLICVAYRTLFVFL